MKKLSDMKEVDIAKFLEKEYRDFQLYTLEDRAIPYLSDGLKPVQRKILYALFKNANKGLTKVSSVTGLVLSYHPHGTASIESAIVNMAQNFVFSNNYPLIAKKGWFGERMEPMAAAPRYIECELAEITKELLFDDLNQVEMIPTYDEKNMEPKHLLPKLPIMLLNGAEGIGTGFSCIIPSYHHKDLIDAMLSFIKTKKIKKLTPFFDGFKNEMIYEKEKNRYLFNIKLEKINGKFFITELPRGVDAKKIYEHLKNLIEKDIIRDYTDNSVKNDINIEIILKKGYNPRLETLYEQINISTYMNPNFTLINDDGVVIYDNVEKIIEHFTTERLKIVKRRYELLHKDCQDRIIKSSELIRFIKDKHYAVAESKIDKGSYIDYLKKNKFIHFEYLASLPIYRMTKDEVEKAQNIINEDKKMMKDYEKIFKNPKEVENTLIDELQNLNLKLNNLLRKKWDEKAK